jgi:hypothetical protein
MTETYVDEECHYLGGDPRLSKTGSAEVELQTECIRIKLLEGDQPAIHIPRSAMKSVFALTERLDSDRALYEEDIAIEPEECLLRYAAIITFDDPEKVQPFGLKVRLAFRDQYFSKVFAKRCEEKYHVAPF